ncbi:amidohydrolase [Bacteroidota bacterium]
MELKKVDIAIEHATVLCIDNADTIIEDACILIKNKTILDIAGYSEISGTYTADKILNGGNKLVMPGLINTHTHSAMSIFRGYADDLRLEEWLEKFIWPAEAKFINSENVYLGALLSIMEMIRSGTICFTDMYFFEDEVAKASIEAGFRVLLGEAILDNPTPNKKTPEEGLEYTIELINKYKNEELVSVSVAPHAIYTCSTDKLKKIRNISEENNCLVQIHLAETQYEFDTCLKETGHTPVSYLNSLGLLNSRLIASHCNILTDEDIKLLSNNKAKVSHNPQSNMKLASGMAPVIKLLDNDICIGLGTDGAASNNNLNMFKEIAMVAKLHKIFSKDPTQIDAKTAVRLASINSAKVLGMDSYTGSIEKGKKADMIIIDLNQTNLVPLYNIYSQLAYSMESCNVDTVIVNGKILMENRKLLTIDEELIITEVKKISKKIQNMKT